MVTQRWWRNVGHAKVGDEIVSLVALLWWFYVSHARLLLRIEIEKQVWHGKCGSSGTLLMVIKLTLTNERKRYSVLVYYANKIFIFNTFFLHVDICTSIIKMTPVFSELTASYNHNFPDVKSHKVFLLTWKSITFLTSLYSIVWFLSYE